jgi:hypothetical protein
MGPSQGVCISSVHVRMAQANFSMGLIVVQGDSRK